MVGVSHMSSYCGWGTHTNVQLNKYTTPGLLTSVHCVVEYMYQQCLPSIRTQGLRSKTHTLKAFPQSPDELPVWNFEGSSTGQSVGHDSDIYIRPQAIFRCVCVWGGGGG